LKELHEGRQRFTHAPDDAKQIELSLTIGRTKEDITPTEIALVLEFIKHVQLLILVDLQGPI